jgi:hypothetical protein
MLSNIIGVRFNAAIYHRNHQKIIVVAMISCLSWVPKGAAREKPVRFELSADEYSRIQLLAKAEQDRYLLQPYILLDFKNRIKTNSRKYLPYI